jgi:hypothetical protein
MNCEQLSDFLPNLSGIKGATPPTLIPLDVLGGPPPQATKTSKNSPGLSLDKETHSGSQTSETFKYNLRSRSRGAPIFSGGIAGGLGTLETIDSKPSLERGKKSLISLAQKQANSKVRSGRQLSLIGALRENSPRDVPK